MRARLTIALLPLLLIAACQGSGIRGDGPPAGSGRIPDLPGDAIPRNEPRSKYGNGPNYEVFGKHYTVMASGRGYQERGVASWYGKKFHGNLTSNREVYDMYAMTAAHKTLPLPSYVRVRNLVNDKSVVVRVNDRGPFVHNRIIDLSYSAALRLDMIKDGTSMVEVTVIDFDAPSGDRVMRRSTPPEPTTAPPLVSLPSVGPHPAPTPEPEPEPAAVDSGHSEHKIFVQVGAFGDRSNAERRLAALAAAGINNAFVHEDATSDPALLRVRIGPVADVVQYDVLVEELANIGITDPYLAAD
ncbi:MAG: septal ring lytic transglycosylase RlpA family protein [Woeseiaceae bacterium]